MAAESPSITTLNPDDVLSGRGTGPNEWIGNQRFRDIVDSRRKEYIAETRPSMKTKIAEEVFRAVVKKRKGRFLSRVDKTESFVVEDGVWVELSRGEAMEKIKQALRQHRRPPKEARTRRRNSENSVGESSFLPLEAASHVASNTAYLSPGGSMASRQPASLPLLPPCFVGSSGLPPVDAHFLLFQRSGLNLYSMAPLASYNSNSPEYLNGMALPDAYPSAYDCLHHRPSDDTLQQWPPPQYSYRSAALGHQLTGSLTHQLFIENSSLQYRSVHPVQTTSTVKFADSVPSGAMSSSGLAGGAAAREASTSAVATVKETSTSAIAAAGEASPARKAITSTVTSEIDPSAWEKDSSGWASDDEVSDFLLASLGWDSNHPRFTEEDFIREQSNMTNEERSSALIDLFGKFCSVSDHQNKKARKDLQRESIAFLVKQMKVEIERIPENKRRALTEARKKCRADELSDERLEQFLRCEGMNPKVSVDASEFFMVRYVRIHITHHFGSYHVLLSLEHSAL